jgi:hypothetical protein
MYVKIGSLEIKEPDLQYVTLLGAGYSGFDFRGIAPEQKSEQIREILQAMKEETLQTPIPCEAITTQGRTKKGYLRQLEEIDIQPIEGRTPVMYRFYVVVKLQN